MQSSMQRVTKTVQFEDGKVIYIGDPPKPKISAEEQDLINEKSDQLARQEEEDEKKRHREEYRQVMGPASAEEESRKVAPSFVEVP